MTVETDYTSILRALPDLYLILNDNFNIIDATDTYLKKVHKSREQVIGKNVFDVFPDNPKDPTADGQKNLRNSLKRVLQKKRAHKMHIQRYDLQASLSKNNKFIKKYWSPLNIPVLKKEQVNYIVHRVEDVTELMALKDKELKHKHNIDLILKNIKDCAILMLDKKGYVLTWNIGAQLLFGYTSEEVVGKYFSIFYPQATFSSLNPEKLLNAATQTQHIADQSWRIKKDGSRFWADSVLTPIFDDNNELIGFSEIIQDKTNQKNLDRLKNEIISIINHELRTPLTSIFGSIRLLINNKGNLDSEQNKKLLEIANSNCDHLIQLINDILDIDKLDANEMKLNIQIHEALSIVKEAVALNKAYADAYGVKLVIHPCLSDINIQTDATRVIQVLTHLISNAVKFSYIHEAVTIGLLQQGNRLIIKVINKGDGIPEAYKDKIFAKFSQADSSTQREKSGKGLGLAISKAILKKLGTELKFISEMNKETVFYFDLPIV